MISECMAVGIVGQSKLDYVKKAIRGVIGGRPKKKWMDCVNDNMCKKGGTFHQWEARVGRR